MSQASGINGSPLLHTLLRQADTVGSAKASRTGGAPPLAASATQDRAQVSSAAASLTKAGVEDDVRLDKVAALQAAITNGTYSVAASDVADKLVQSLLR